MNYFSHFLMPGKAVLAVGQQIIGYAVFKLFVSEMLEIAICTYKCSVLEAASNENHFFSKKKISHNLISLFLSIHR